MRRLVTVISACLHAALLTGCATVMDGSEQSVSVETRHGDVSVRGARCLLKNDQGESWLTTPGSANVRFDRSDLNVFCSHSSFESPGSSASSQVKPEVLGNLLVGGLIGLGVDHFGGSAYRYPSRIVVEMAPRPEVVASPDPTVRRMQRSPVSRGRATSVSDEIRSLELVRSVACEPAGPLTLQTDHAAEKHYAIACLDGRTAKTVCQPWECRFKTLDD